MAENIGTSFNGITTTGTIQQLKSNNGLLINSNKLSELDDVTIATPISKQSIVYDSGTSKWSNQDLLLASSLTDVTITSPLAEDRIVYNPTILKWVNQQPYYFSIQITGKLKDSYIQSMVGSTTLLNLLYNDSTKFDSYTVNNTSANGLYMDASGNLNGFRNNSLYSWESSINMSILTCAANSYFYYGFARTPATVVNTILNYNSLNNPAKTLTMTYVNTFNSPPYYPFINMSNSNVFTGNTNGDFSFSLAIYEY